MFITFLTMVRNKLLHFLSFKMNKIILIVNNTIDHVFLIGKILSITRKSDQTFDFRIAANILFIVLTIAFNLSAPLVLKWIISFFGESQPYSKSIFLLLFAYGLLWMGSKISIILRELFMLPLMERAVSTFISIVIKHMHHLPMSVQVNFQTGGIISILERIKHSLPALIWGALFLLIPLIIEFSVASVILWVFFGLPYALVFFSTIVLFSILSTTSSKNAIQLKRLSNEKEQAVSNAISDNILNHEIIRYSAGQDLMQSRLNNLLLERQEAKTQSLLALETIQLYQDLVIGIGFTMLILLSGFDIVAEKLKITDLVLINGYLIQIIAPLTSFGLLYRNFKTAIVDIEKVLEILAQHIPPISNISKKNKISRGEIQFEEVCFNYPERPPLIKNLSFSISPGQHVAIVGASGSGKTTLTKLLFQFYPYTSGRILIDGKELHNFDYEDLCKGIGIVPQDIVLFNESIYQNITYGIQNLSPDWLKEVLETTHLSQLLESLPNGIHTVVGERGLKLSGGEKQRILLARLLLKSPSILIFDESTANLDSMTSTSIQKAIHNLSINKTTINISHNLSSITHCDKIFVIKNGSLIEADTHEKLLKKCDYYHQLWTKQSRNGSVASVREL